MYLLEYFLNKMLSLETLFYYLNQYFFPLKKFFEIDHLILSFRVNDMYDNLVNLNLFLTFFLKKYLL